MSEPTTKQAEAKTVKPVAKDKKDTPTWATALQTIGGDNKLMNAILKVVLSPLGIVAALCGIGYLLWKNKTYQDKIKELEEELHNSQMEVNGLEKDVEHLKKGKRAKRNDDDDDDEQDNEPEYRSSRPGFVPLQPLSGEPRRSEKRRSIYLD